VTGALFALSTPPTEDVVASTPIETPEPEIVVATTTEPLFEEPSTVAALLTAPISDAASRVTIKPFGTFIEAGRSPVPNDRFSGFHVGVDFEAFAHEQDTDVPIFAVCDGPLLNKIMAKGYGGVALQTCVLEGREVTVIYGHIRLSSVSSEPKDFIKQGQQIAVLGTGGSEETDGVRKHLHLGIQTGSPDDIRGYVSDEELVHQWLDVMTYIAP